MKDYEYVNEYMKRIGKDTETDSRHNLLIMRSIVHEKLMKTGFFFQRSKDGTFISRNFRISKMPQFKTFRNFDEALLGTIDWINSGAIAWT